MLNAVIVDDEHKNRQTLMSLLQKFCPDVNVVGEADDVETAFDIISDKKPSLVFLDIQMPRGNGFQLLEKFKSIFFEIIFVTSFDQYAITAIKFSALDYLLKPIDVNELKLAVEKAKEKTEKENKFLLYQNLLQNVRPDMKDKKMAIHVNNKVVFIQMSKIAYIEADSNYSHIHLTDPGSYHTAKTLKEIEEFTAELPGFVRVNRHIIINTAACSHYQKGEPAQVTLKNGKSFEISRRKRPEVLEKLKTLIAQ